MIKFNALQETFPTDFSGLVTENNLNAILATKVQNASEFTSRLYEVNCGMDLENYLRQYPVKRLKTEDDYRWFLQGNEDKNIPLLEARLTSTGSAISASDQTGLGVTRFFLLFPEMYFSDTNVIIGTREIYPIRICSDPTPEGSNWLYECELLLGDLTAFIPYEELQANIRFSKEWSPTEQTLSKKGGTPNYTSPFSFRNTFTNIRMQATHPGNMLERPVEFKWVTFDANGKVQQHSTWMEYADWVFMKQFREQKNKALMFARPNKDANDVYRNVGSSNFTIRQGAGLRAQMETSNTIFYSNFSIDWLTEAIIDMTAGKLREDRRKVLLRTGEWGLYQFHKSLEAKSQLYTPLFDPNRIQYSGDKITFRGQFFDYRGPNGVAVSLQHEPMYDDKVRNKVLSSQGRGVAESYRYDLLFSGTIDGEPNIQLVVPEGGEAVQGYIPGMRHPYMLKGQNNIMATPEDGYTVHRQEQFGTMIKNPLLTAQFIPSELA